MAVEKGDRALVAQAARVCINNVLHIKEDSSLLLSMPPAFFWHFIVYSTHLCKEKYRSSIPQFNAVAMHVHDLARSYLDRNGRRLGLPYFFALFDEISCMMPSNTEDAFLEIMCYLGLMKRKRWNIRGHHDQNASGSREVFEKVSGQAIYDYSIQEGTSDSEVANLMSKVPHCIAADLFD